MDSAPPAAAGTRVQARRPSPILAVLVVLAAGVLAVFAGAALADLDLGAVGFERALPVVLLGEGLLYLLILGGGTVSAPVLFSAWLLGFAYRAGLAVCAHLLSPAPGAADLFEGWEHYYVSCWPAAVAQALLVAVALRLVRPAIATRRRTVRPQPRRRPSPAPQPPMVPAGRDELIAALVESPDAPPRSTTVLEERQIGDLAEAQGDDATAAPVGPRLDVALPLLQEQTAEAAPQTPTNVLPEPEPAPGPEPEPESPEPLQVGDTDRLDPVAPAPEPAPVGSVQRMVDTVVSQASADDIEIRVWRTGDRRTILAGMPAGTNTAAVAPIAEALARAQVRLCDVLAVAPESLLLAATELGAFGLRALDFSGGLLLLLASRGEQAAETLPDGMDEVVAAIGDVATLAEDVPGRAAPSPASPLAADAALTQSLAQSVVLSAILPHDWRGWRNADGMWYALAAPRGTDGAALVAALAAAVPEIERVLLALGLGGPHWLALVTADRTLTACPAMFAGEPGVIAALTAAGHTPQQVARELLELVKEAGT